MAFIVYLLLLFLSVDGWRIVLRESGYNSEGDYTEFLYEITDPSSNPVKDVLIGIPHCDVIELLESNPSDFSVEGLTWTDTKTSGSQSRVKISGYIQTGTIDYSITSSSGSVSGKVNGPICESIPVLECNAGPDRTASCEGRVVLSANACKHANKFSWSTTEPGVTIHQGQSREPTVILPAACDTTVVISLTVEGQQGQTATCQAYVAVKDEQTPKLLGLYADDIEVDCDDIPSPSIVTASDNCGDSPTVSYSETTIASTITRTWSATDSCGLETEHVQVITVNDKEAPTFSGVPDDETQACHVLPEPCEVVAYDNCDTSVSVTETEKTLAGTCDDTYRIVRSWTATDKAGLTISRSQTVEVRDVEEPTLIGIPENYQIHCGDLPPIPDATGVDNCSPSVTVSVDEIKVDHVNPPSDFRYAVIRTFSATDRCGNTAEHPWTIEIDDIESPIISGVDSEKTVNCGEIPPPCEVAVIDNCDDFVTVVLVEKTTEGSCSNTYTITRIWTAVDGNGNAAEESQVIHVIDTSVPKWTKSIAPELFSSCDYVPVIDLDATDTCGEATVIKSTETIPGTSVVHYTLVHTWVATDECGLTSTKKQTIHVEDNSPPTLSGLPSPYVEDSCTATINEPFIVATDNCPDCEVAIDSKEVRHDGSCTHEYTLVREWIATDCGGHTVSHTQSIKIKDSEPPKLIGLGGHLTVPVGFVPDAAVVTATDNCDDDVPVTATERIEAGSCDDEETVIRFWEASDDCGNIATHFQTVHVIDNEAPVFNEFIEDCDVSCDNIPNDSVTATDNSGRPVTITLETITVPGSCDDTYKLIRTFIATDLCGNTISQTHTVHATDTDGPMILQGDDFQSVLVLPTFVASENKEASDNCDPSVEVVSTEETVSSDDGCSTEFSVIYTWTTEDRCGNQAVPLIQTVEVHDTAVPTFSHTPESLTAECDTIPSPPTVTAVDSDGSSTPVTYTENTNQGECSHSYQLIRTWETNDCASNFVKHVCTITVVDSITPILTAAPDDLLVSCGDIPQGSPSDVSVSDNCQSAITVDYQEVKINPDNSESEYVLVRTWKANDGCTDDVSVEQVIRVQDDVPPTVQGVPADLTLGCDDEIPSPQTLSCSDDCDTTSSAPEYVQSEDVPSNCIDGLVKTIIRSWTCIDSSANSITQFQTIIVEDLQAPVFLSHPLSQTINCDADVPPAPPVLVSDCDSNINSPVVTPRTIHGTTTNEYRVIYKWVATDSCGHHSDIEQTITVEDTEGPTLTAHPSENVDCKADVSRPEVEIADNCIGSPSVSATTDTVTGTCKDRFVVTHHWQATDASGNVGNSVQMSYTSDDTEAPTFAQPTPVITISYTSLNQYPKLQLVLTDNCDDNPVSTCTRDKTEGDCPHVSTLIDVCEVSDRCGNDATASRTIYVIDDVPPQLGGASPVDGTFQCPDTPPPPPQITSEVGIEVVYDESTISQTCANTYTIERVWTAEDCVHNKATITQTIVFQDTTPPVLSIIPSDVTRECPLCLEDDQALQVDVTATDACDHSVHVDENIDTITENLDAEVVAIYIRTWTAIDLCQNSVTGTQTITVVDTIAPKFQNIPEVNNQVFSPKEIPSVPTTVTCVDDCDETNMIFTEDTEQGSCNLDYKLIRKWVCSDLLGNTISEVRTISVSDITPPMIQNIGPAGPLPLPSDLVTDIVQEREHLTAKDSADDQVIIVGFTESRSNGDDEFHYILIRTWTAKDSCGNSATHIQTITAQPCRTEEEVLIPTIPCHTTVECDSTPTPSEDDEVTDSIERQLKSPDVTIKFIRTVYPGTCDGVFKILRTWEATDIEGNAISDFQSIDVTDNTLPEFDLPKPAEYITVECDAVPEAETLTASDNCGEATVEFQETKTSNPDIHGAYFLTRVWTAEDQCGNIAIHTTQLSVEDTEGPEFVEKPSDVVINGLPCEHPCEFADDNAIVVHDKCSSASYHCEPSWNINTCQTIRHVRCSAYDEAGNAVLYNFDYTYNDVDAPTISSPPAHVSIDCEDPLPPSTNLNVEEPCGVAYSISSSSKWVVISRLDTVIRTWSVSDDCGHSASVDQTITLIDDTPPALHHVPEDTTVSCEHPTVPTQVTATDNCGKEVTITNTVMRTDGECANNYTLLKTFVATDASGLTTSEQFMIVVVDTISPVIHGIPSSDLEHINAHCGLIPTPPHNVIVTDNCDDSPDYTYTEEKVTEGLADGEYYLLIRTWSALDACDNFVSFVQTIHVSVDNTAPVLSSVPFDINIRCDEPFETDDPTVDDDCDHSLSITKTEVTEEKDCANSYNIIFTWTVTDSSGNTAKQVQTVHVTDTDPPILFGVPENKYVSCSDIPPAAEVTSQDQCGQASTVTVGTKKVEHDDTADYEIIYTYMATDPCGNGFIDAQTLFVSDASNPVFSVDSIPVDQTISCEVPLPSFPELEVSDSCDNEVDIRNSTTRKHYDCSNHYDTFTTWTATDDNGNFATVTWSIFVIDQTPPTFLDFDPESNDLVDITVQCNEPAVVPLEVEDNCDASLAVNIGTTSIKIDGHTYPPENRDILERYYWTIDTCGNKVEHTQTITIIDNIPPTLSGEPTDVSVPCSTNDLSLYDDHEVMIHDECTSGTLERTSQITPGSCDEEYTKTYNYQGFDENGNSVEYSFVVTVIDDVKPILSNIPQWNHDSFECDALPDENQTSVVTAYDLCAGPLTVHFESQNSDQSENAFSYSIDYVWSAVDPCGNIVSRESTVQILDSKSPTLSCGDTSDCSDRVIECGGIPGVPEVIAVDNCDPDAVATFDETTESTSCDSQYTLIRTWTTIDSSGNSNDLKQTVTVQNTVPPSLIFDDTRPSDATVSCNSVPSAPTVTANHDCEEVHVTYSEDKTPGSCSSTYTLTRTWDAIDCVGLKAEHTQIITVSDSSAPVLSATPAHITVQVDAIKSTWPGMLSATDNCDGSLPVKFTQTKEAGTCKHNFDLIRMWSVEDLCGNIAVHHQTVTVIDTIPPELQGVPAAIFVEYEEVKDLASPSSLGVTATDNSKAKMTVHVSENTVEGACATEYKLIRTWDVADPCGNSNSEEQVINVVDHTPPIIEIPDDETVECDAIPLICEVKVSVAFTDHPDVNLEVHETEVILSGQHDYSYRIIRSWWVQDCAGNMVEADQTLVVQDTTKPVFTRIYPDTTTDCDCETDSELFQIDALDNCEGVLDSVLPDITKVDGSSQDNYVVYRQWSAQDTSGNVAEHVQTVTVQDITPPTWCEDEELPSTLMYEQCDSVPPRPELKAQDDCDPEIIVAFTEETIKGDCDNNYRLKRTWVATDRSGNSLSHTTEVIVSDAFPPTLLNTQEKLCLWPANGKIAVYKHASEALIDVVDNCGSVETTIANCTSSEVTTIESCVYNAAQDTLYLKIEQNSLAGRTYKVTATVVDGCGNRRNNAVKKIWIPPTQEQFNAAIDDATCSGTGADNYISSIPNF